MSRDITIAPLTAADFAPFGDVIAAAGDPSVMINQGKCGRYHDLARLDFDGADARAGISIFEGTPYDLPLDLVMLERHPLGSQAFLPLSEHPFLVIVSKDNNGVPEKPQAFMTAPGQGVNYHRGTWHAVLTPLGGTRLFAVIDRIGPGDNLEEHWFSAPYRVRRQQE